MIFAIFLAVAEALQSDQICALETEGPVPWKAVPKLPRSRSAEGRAQRAPFLFQNDPLQSLKTPHNPVQRRVEAVRAQLAARLGAGRGREGGWWAVRREDGVVQLQLAATFSWP